MPADFSPDVMSAKPNFDPIYTPAGVVSRAQEEYVPGEIRFHLRAHCSLSPRAARWFFLSVASAPLLTSAYCVAHGWWPVLPFAGAELGLLAVVLRHSMRRGRQQECITITDDHVTINAQLGAIPATTRFSRHWTRVKLRAPPTPYPHRLCFESQGRVCEVGRFLTEDERAVLAVRLQQLVGGMSDSPPL